MPFLSTVAISAVLIYASVSDIRRREVPDVCWAIICAIAVVDYSRSCPDGVLVSACFILTSLAILWERLDGWGGNVFLIIGLLGLFTDSILLENPVPAVSSVMTIVMLALYHEGLIKGGADAKALIALSMAFPTYQITTLTVWVPEYPLALIINPAFSILALSLVMSMAGGIYVLCRSMGSERISFVSFPMALSDARSAHVWPAQDIVDGILVDRIVYDDVQTAFDRLEESGLAQVRVTPMIPFIVPITASFVIVALFGSPLMGAVI
jgi:hypothetical protein